MSSEAVGPVLESRAPAAAGVPPPPGLGIEVGVKGAGSGLVFAATPSSSPAPLAQLSAGYRDLPTTCPRPARPLLMRSLL